MTDEDKKKIVSEPPPPTDEIDGEWGDDEQTLVRDVSEGVTKSQPAASAAAVAGTSVAPISVPAKVAEASTPPEVKAARIAAETEEDEGATEDEDDQAQDEGEDEDEDEDEDEEPAHAVPARPATGHDWIPEWAPYAVLGLLVSVSILVGLGLIGGGSAVASDAGAQPEPSAHAPAKPSQHP